MYWLIDRATYDSWQEDCKSVSVSAVELETWAAELNEPRTLSEPQSAGDTAVINVNGVLTDRPDFFARYFGGGNATYSDIVKAVAAAEADSNVKQITLKINSPGGTVSAAMLEAYQAVANSSKPITAEVGDMAASAAYGLASQATSIVAKNNLSKVGSVGIIVTTRKDGDRVNITSSNAPNKAPDVSTDEGQQTIRAWLDKMETIFIDSIAEGRNTTPAKVKTDYGQGGIVLAEEALEAGMIDKLSNAGGTDASGNKPKPTALGGTTKGFNAMDLNQLKAEHPSVYAQVVEIGQKAERDRVQAHLVLAEGSGAMDVAVKAIKEGSEISELVKAEHLSFSMKAAQLKARGEETESEDGEELEVEANADETPKSDKQAKADEELNQFNAVLAAELGVTINE